MWADRFVLICGGWRRVLALHFLNTDVQKKCALAAKARYEFQRVDGSYWEVNEKPITAYGSYKLFRTYLLRYTYWILLSLKVKVPRGMVYNRIET